MQETKLPADALVDKNDFARVRSFCKGMVRLGDGADIVIWDGNGYERRGEGFACTFPIAIEGSELRWTYAPAGNDGFFYLSNRRLFEVHRTNSTPIPHLERFANIMEVEPGPAGTLLLFLGTNKRGDIGLVYFPAEDSVIYLEPELFGEMDPDKFAWALLWSADSHRILTIIQRPAAIRALPVDFVLSLPRHHAKTGKRIGASGK